MARPRADDPLETWSNKPLVDMLLAKPLMLPHELHKLSGCSPSHATRIVRLYREKMGLPPLDRRSTMQVVARERLQNSVERVENKIQAESATLQAAIDATNARIVKERENMLEVVKVLCQSLNRPRLFPRLRKIAETGME